MAQPAHKRRTRTRTEFLNERALLIDLKLARAAHPRKPGMSYAALEAMGDVALDTAFGMSRILHAAGMRGQR